MPQLIPLSVHNDNDVLAEGTVTQVLNGVEQPFPLDADTVVLFEVRKDRRKSGDVILTLDSTGDRVEISDAAEGKYTVDIDANGLRPGQFMWYRVVVTKAGRSYVPTHGPFEVLPS